MKIFNKNSLLRSIDEAIREMNILRKEVEKSFTTPVAIADSAYNQGYRLYLMDRTAGGKPPMAEMILTVASGEESTVKGGDDDSHAAILAFVDKYMDVESGEYWVIPLEPTDEVEVKPKKVPESKREVIEDAFEPVPLFKGSTVVYPTDHPFVKDSTPIAILKASTPPTISVTDKSFDEGMVQIIKEMFNDADPSIFSGLTLEEREYGLYVVSTDTFVDYTKSVLDVDLDDKGEILKTPNAKVKQVATINSKGTITFRMSDEDIASTWPNRRLFAIKKKVETKLKKAAESEKRILYFVVPK